MIKSVNFTKMQGLGNDFIIVEGNEVKKHNLDYSELAIKMCDRHFGIGADGLIIVNPSEINTNTDTSWRIFNADGSEPQMCGNGIRCFAKYIYEKGIITKKSFSIHTLAGIIVPEVLDNGEVRVDMGKPILEPKQIPTSIEDIDKVVNYSLKVDNKEFKINAISMGNPHCIIFTDDDSAQMAKIYGPKLEKSDLFPEKTNVEFVKILSNDRIKVDVWERGCGITLACGTGACASTVAAILNGYVNNFVIVDLPGGSLKVEWVKNDSFNKVFMTGKSDFVFEGKYF